MLKYYIMILFKKVFVYFFVIFYKNILLNYLMNDRNLAMNSIQYKINSVIDRINSVADNIINKSTISSHKQLDASQRQTQDVLKKASQIPLEKTLENIYTAIQDITEYDIPQIYRMEIYRTNYFCKRILNLTRILTQEKIVIKQEKRDKLLIALIEYAEKNGINDYLIPHIGWLELTCPFSVLFQTLKEILVYPIIQNTNQQFQCQKHDSQKNIDQNSSSKITNS